MRALALATVLCAVAAPAARAQSKRYPPVAPDKDAQAEAHSQVWSATIHPDRAPYQELVRDAKRLIDHGDPGDIPLAMDKLSEAIKRQPRESDAYAIRGQFYLARREWGKCAEDLALAEGSTKDDPMQRTRGRIDLAVCQSRAGHYAEAEQTLMRAASVAQSYKAELMMRLGETRIALGKLDEAIEALQAAIEANDSLNDTSRWLLAVAYDRARRPTDAQQAAIAARTYDQSLSFITSPRVPYLGPGETDYIYGVAYLYAIPKPEYALLYFRHYLKAAGDTTPWKRRAEDHVKELSEMKLPAKDSITIYGSAPVNIDEARNVLSKPMPEMRQCVAKLPGTAIQVTVTRSHTGQASREAPLYRIPVEGTDATPLLDLSGTAAKADLDEARQCLERIASRAPLPKPKEANTYYRLSFLVVGP